MKFSGLYFLIIFSLLLPAAVVAQNYMVGDTAPAFQDLDKYHNGVFAGTISSSDFSGKVTLYHFFGST